MSEVSVSDLAVAPVSPLVMARQAEKGAKKAGGFKPVTGRPEWSADQFLDQAKQLVVDNYNAHRNTEKVPPITPDLIYVAAFTKAAANWVAHLASPVLGGLMYEVTYIGTRSQAIINVYRKINTATISY